MLTRRALVRPLPLLVLVASLSVVLLDGVHRADAQVGLQQLQAAADSVEAGLERSLVRQETEGRSSTPLQFLGWLFHVSARNAGERVERIAVVIVIGVLAKLAMDLVKRLSGAMISSRRRPFCYLFRNRKRAVTIHGLVISLLKYVVYFTAFGYILNELGINYQTYLASLSLIGIALGFGAQGLVQDVVTGFFIIFEDQFGVGDLVEISGQVGVIEELGLRTTRLQNFAGAEIIFQNRNIPMAIRYPRGAEALVDVAVAGPQVAAPAAERLQLLGVELAKQFRQVILQPPESQGLLQLATGECFVRLYVRFWPQQQWVVEAQLVPRIREEFARAGLEIPGDRVVVFYHLPDGLPGLADASAPACPGAPA